MGTHQRQIRFHRDMLTTAMAGRVELFGARAPNKGEGQNARARRETFNPMLAGRLATDVHHRRVRHERDRAALSGNRDGLWVMCGLMAASVAGMLVVLRRFRLI